MSMGRQGKSWPGITWTISLYTARAMGLDPRVARGQKKRLEPGNVITIEPGVYAAGIGGIRIEDDVAVHTDRTEVLTRVPRDLIEI
jgi:Xaa-Pro aminopeptidase